MGAFLYEKTHLYRQIPPGFQPHLHWHPSRTNSVWKPRMKQDTIKTHHGSISH